MTTTSAAIVYPLIRWFPIAWWLPAGAMVSTLIIVLTALAPVVLLPLFYRLKPLSRESLRVRLLSMADRAGAQVLDVYEWGLGDKTRKANAALTGLWKSRRILVSDTMLADYSDEEIEVVLAHEIAHHAHGDIWKGLLLESAVIFAGLFVASRALARVVQPLALDGPSDVAGLPVIALSVGVVSLMAIPVALAISRSNERRADREALWLTRNPTAFISAIRRLGSQNLAESHPSRFVQWLFHSHPPVPDRIAAAEAFNARDHLVGSMTRAM
jgi:STE24 endopeptidase